MSLTDSRDCFVAANRGQDAEMVPAQRSEEACQYILTAASCVCMTSFRTITNRLRHRRLVGCGSREEMIFVRMG